MNGSRVEHGSDVAVDFGELNKLSRLKAGVATDVRKRGTQADNVGMGF